MKPLPLRESPAPDERGGNTPRMELVKKPSSIVFDQQVAVPPSSVGTCSLLGRNLLPGSAPHATNRTGRTYEWGGSEDGPPPAPGLRPKQRAGCGFERDEKAKSKWIPAFAGMTNKTASRLVVTAPPPGCPRGRDLSLRTFSATHPRSRQSLPYWSRQSLPYWS